jgi:hypothetical protein
MKKLSFIVFIASILFLSCTTDENSQEQDSEKLEKMYNEIIVASLSNSEPCTNSEEWDFAPIGSKACGGHAGYIVYSKKIQTEEFFTKIKKYTDAQSDFNKKWGIMSDCSITIKPAGVQCAEGKPVLIYSIASN